MIAIADTGPIIHLSWLGLLDLLHSQFEKVIIPSEVRRELLSAPDDTRGLTAILMAIEEGGLVVYEGTLPEFPGPSLGLGAGETGAILLALHLEGIMLTDDADARLTADARGIPVMGTLGVLMEARRRGLISAVYPLLVELRHQGFWLSRELIEAVRQAEA